MDSGRSSKFQIVSLVRKPASLSPSIGGAVGLDPVATVTRGLKEQDGVLDVKVSLKEGMGDVLLDIPFSSSTIISRRLKELQENGLVKKISESGRISYKLTGLGCEGLKTACDASSRYFDGTHPTFTHVPP